jgi:hypothetical protein
VINVSGMFNAQVERHECILPRPARIRKLIIGLLGRSNGALSDLRPEAIQFGRISTLPPIGVPRLRGFLEQSSPDRLKAELRTGQAVGVGPRAVSRCALRRSNGQITRR